jgi:hypothetical protein
MREIFNQPVPEEARKLDVGGDALPKEGGRHQVERGNGR